MIKNYKRDPLSTLPRSKSISLPRSTSTMPKQKLNPRKIAKDSTSYSPPHKPPRLPLEIIDKVIDKVIERIPDKKEAYKAAVGLRRIYIRDKLIPRMRYATMNSASKKGQVELLDWWKTGPETHYTETALCDASRYGHIDVLEWWRKSGLELKALPSVCLDMASEQGHVAVLEWWKSSGIELECPLWALSRAIQDKQLKVLQWWESSGLDLKLSGSERFDAQVCGDAEVLEWWIRFESRRN